MGPFLGQKWYFRPFSTFAISTQNTYLDIASVIYEVETILTPLGLFIFLRGVRWWCLFYSILENDGATGDFYRYLAPKSDKKTLFVGPLRHRSGQICG